MSAETGTIEVRDRTVDYSVGRGGIRIPEQEWSPGNSIGNLTSFFETLWAINHPHPEQFYSRYNYFEHHALDLDGELVVPADAGKPLVVLRSQYRPKVIRTPELKLDCLSPTDGVTSHQLLQQPASVGPFEEVTSIRTNEHRGPADRAYYIVSFLGQQLIELTSEESNAQGLSVEQVWEKAEARYDQEAQAILGATKEMLR